MTTKKPSNYVTTFLGPSGIVEQHFVGSQNPSDILEAIQELGVYSKKLQKQDKPLLILVDVSKVTRVDLSKRMQGARKAGIEAMRSVGYEKAAVCGPLSVQILVSTMALVAGVHSKVKVFDNRVNALRWLRTR